MFYVNLYRSSSVEDEVDADDFRISGRFVLFYKDDTLVEGWNVNEVKTFRYVEDED